MKNQKKHTKRSTKTAYTILAQIVKHIPQGLIPELAERHGIDARKFSATSHVVALLFGQLAGNPGLNSVVDAAAAFGPEWSRVRGATPPCRNTFSNANRTRDPAMAEELFWKTHAHFALHFPDFAGANANKGYLSRVKKNIYAIDSTTLQLALNCFDWARHRRKKAAAKLHLRLDIANTLPAFAVVESAAGHDSTRADALCAGLKRGDIATGDRAYTSLPLMRRLGARGVNFVLRQKDNMRLKVIAARALPNSAADEAEAAAKTVILADETVAPDTKESAAKHPATLRRVTAEVEVKGRMKTMRFLTNNTEWSPRTIAELYKSRWTIETFFKELKQTCAINDFVGYNENAVKWQVWTALLAHLILRFISFAAKWKAPFSRLAGVVRAAVMLKRELFGLLKLYGTARTAKTRVPLSVPFAVQLLLPLLR